VLLFAISLYVGVKLFGNPFVLVYLCCTFVNEAHLTEDKHGTFVQAVLVKSRPLYGNWLGPKFRQIYNLETQENFVFVSISEVYKP